MNELQYNIANNCLAYAAHYREVHGVGGSIVREQQRGQRVNKSAIRKRILTHVNAMIDIKGRSTTCRGVLMWSLSVLG